MPKKGIPHTTPPSPPALVPPPPSPTPLAQNPTIGRSIELTTSNHKSGADGRLSMCVCSAMQSSYAHMCLARMHPATYALAWLSVWGCDTYTRIVGGCHVNPNRAQLHLYPVASLRPRPRPHPRHRRRRTHTIDTHPQHRNTRTRSAHGVNPAPANANRRNALARPKLLPALWPAQPQPRFPPPPLLDSRPLLANASQK